MKLVSLLLSSVVFVPATLWAADLPKVGDAAPDFTVAASDGTTVQLKEVIGQGQIVGEKYNLPFVLLADTDKKIAKAYGAAGDNSPVANRVTFVINKAGKIAFVFPSVNPATHAAELRQALATLAE